MKATVRNKSVAIATWDMNSPARMKRKKTMTPRLMIQKAASLSRAVSRSVSSFFIRVKITDMEIREMGKEKPRKKVSSLSFSRVNHLRYTELRITGLENSRPRERQSRAAW